MTGLRTTVAALAASGVLDHGRNRELVAEAAGLPVPMAAHAPTQAREHAGTCVGTHASAGAWVDPLLVAVLGEPRRIPRLEGEDAVQASIVLGFDVGTRAGRWSIVAVMVRNDFPQRRAPKALLERSPGLVRWDQGERREAARDAARAAAMGLRRGCPDLLLLTPGSFGFLEVKSAGGALSPEQRRWRDLAAAAGWHWGLARGWDDALRAVRAWGWVG